MPALSSIESVQQAQFLMMANAYERDKEDEIRPEIVELAENFHIDERVSLQLHETMRERKESFDSDMQALWVGLEGARNPSGLLMIKIQEMKAGVFKGMSALDRDIKDFAERHRLDAQATVKLCEVLSRREDPEGDMKKIGKHLERSNKPSSLMMLMLKDLRDGKPVKEPEHSAAIGSRVHETEDTT